MTTILGIAVAAESVRAVLADRGAIRWAGEAAYEDARDLAEVVARLAGGVSAPVCRARVVLERDVVQLRSVSPAPPLKNEGLRRYVALELPRLFRKNGAVLVADAVRIRGHDGSMVLWAGAAPESVVEAALAGCQQAGLRVEAIGPAADVLPRALASAGDGEIAVPNGGGSELLSVARDGVWRSRRVAKCEPATLPWSAPLAGAGPNAAYLAAAYAATLARPRLDLSPPSLEAERRRAARRRLSRLSVAGGCLWLAAAALYAARLGSAARAVAVGLSVSAQALDTELSLRRDLGAATATLATMESAQRTRSHVLGLLAGVTNAVGDSAYLVSLQADPDGTLRFVGYAPAAARVLADLERASELRGARLEAPVTREAVAGRPEMDRFSIVAQRERGP